MCITNRVNLSKVRIDHAKEDLLTARENLAALRYKAANNRAYYAIFHAIRAILALDGVDFSSHSQVIGYFNKNYIKPSIFDRVLGESILWASKSRNDSDYNDFYTTTPEEVERNIESAQNLLVAAEVHIAARVENL